MKFAVYYDINQPVNYKVVFIPFHLPIILAKFNSGFDQIMVK